MRMEIGLEFRRWIPEIIASYAPITFAALMRK